MASETGTVASFSLVGTDVAEGEDYMLLNLPTTEAALAEVEMEFECDPAITKETLANQLKEMEKVMAELGLEPKPEVSVAASGAKAPPSFVQSAEQASMATMRTLEKETLTTQVDQSTNTFTIEGWESLLNGEDFGGLLHRQTGCEAQRDAEGVPHSPTRWLHDTVARGGPGAAPKLVCSDCNAPWGTFPKCLLCKGSSPIDLSSTPLSVIAVEGQNWQLRLTEARPTWVLADAKVTKDSGFVEVGDLGRPPPAAVSGAGPEQLDFGFLKTSYLSRGGSP